MPEAPSPPDRFASPESVARMLGIEVPGVLSLVGEGRIRGVRVGPGQEWRIELDSVEDYLDDQAENVRRTALWEQSQAASFPELWGHGDVRHPD
ncbi:helix-turn-helix domain-containing protein [Microbacterium sp. T32]|uniref:helix-turn-helix domain-containing protein n=1 Tax=Microbacterium sp. T32 TaxID=1776083 RepID=UPI001E59587D|nr:helix-turn-helix domain-containing protein [Microbacterium sp. T32]